MGFGPESASALHPLPPGRACVEPETASVGLHKVSQPTVLSTGDGRKIPAFAEFRHKRMEEWFWMTKSDLVQAVAQKTGLKKVEVERAVDALLGAISEGLAAGDRVRIVGFGTFEVRRRAARTGRNPQTGEEIAIPERAVPAFAPGSELREKVAGK